MWGCLPVTGLVSCSRNPPLCSGPNAPAPRGGASSSAAASAAAASEMLSGFEAVSSSRHHSVPMVAEKKFPPGPWSSSPFSHTMKIPSAPLAVGTGPASEEYPPAALPLITTEEFQDKP